MVLRRTIRKRFISHQTPVIGDLLSQRALTVTKSYFHRELLPSQQKSGTTADAGFFRRFLQRRKSNQSSTMSLSELFSFPVPPPVSVDSVGISVNDARKILRFSQLQKVRSALKQIPMNSISYSEFLTVCINTCNNDNQGLEFSKCWIKPETEGRRELKQQEVVLLLRRTGNNILITHPAIQEL
ncbi:hypothetical protein E3N88_32007 [Mikania micrantha]|uniref:Uncharacterized protein n=1 Tax=Mikania micrantha TaxID=192012 RepID=A0A5N6M9X5_9ASTR|nr:hypothetical protein E3N88_32007 [Mikania micrantha]